jgi:hypothetical protein
LWRGCAARCAAKPVCGDTVANVGWQIWLGAPVAATLLAALVVWWRTRPRAIPPVHERVEAHQRFLDDLERLTPRPAAAPENPS